MHQDIDATITLCVTGNCKGAVGCRSRVSPGDIDEERVKVGRHAVNAGEEIVEASFCFGRKEFKGVVERRIVWGTFLLLLYFINDSSHFCMCG